MSGGTGDDAPRLPPRPPRTRGTEQLALDLASARPMRPSGTHLDADWPAFEEPSLLSLNATRIAIVAARTAAFLWSLYVVVFAFQVRSSAVDHADDANTLAVLGPIVATLIAVTGWLWSDRVALNVHRLGGRLPTRLRCVSAWALPLAFAALLWLTVLRLDPTEEFDIRPMIIVVVLAITFWRPYSLLRRILATLSRMRSDALLGTGYVLDLSALGLLWWQLASWPSAGTAIDSGQADALLGVSAAAAVGLGLNIVVWFLLAVDVSRAEGDRLLALRTRHDHRHLRLRGINPMDPDVRWALLRIRQEEELERRAIDEEERARAEQRAAAGDEQALSREQPELVTVDPLDVPGEQAQAATQPEILTVDSADVAPIATELTSDQPSRLEHRSDVPEQDEPDHVEPAAVRSPPEDIAPRVSDILDSDASELIIADLVGEIANAETSAQILAELVDEVAAENPPEIAVEPVRQAHAPEPAPEPDLDVTLPVEGEEPGSPDLAARLRARLTSGRDVTSAARSSPTFEPRPDDVPASRLARRLDMAGAASHQSPREPPASRIAAAAASAAEADAISSRRDRFAQRLYDSDQSARSQRSLLERLEEYGITPSMSGEEPIVPPADEFRNDEERWIPPRLYELEAVRYLLLVGIIVVVVTSAWIVSRTVSVGGELIDGQIAPEDLDRINVARRAFVTASSMTLALVTLWCAVFTSHARRAGAPNTREWRTYSLFAASLTLNVVSFVVDRGNPSTASVLGTFGCLGAALVAVAFVIPLARWFDRRTIGLMTWTAGLAFVTVISWLGGLQHAIQPADALEAITFVAALQAIATAVVVVIAALSTGDLEDAIRLSPALAETSRGTVAHTPAK